MLARVSRLKLHFVGADEAEKRASALEEAGASAQFASQEIAGYVGYRLSVRREGHEVHWRYQGDGEMMAYADAVPISSVLTDGVETREGRLFASIQVNPHPRRVAYHAGYRRKGETLEEVEVYAPDVTELPPELPGDLHRAICAIAAYDMEEKRAGAQVESTFSVGTGSVTRKRLRGAFKADQHPVDLAKERVAHHRRYADV